MNDDFNNIRDIDDNEYAEYVEREKRIFMSFVDSGKRGAVIDKDSQIRLYQKSFDDIFDTLRLLRFKYLNVLNFRYISHSKLRLLAEGIVSGETRPDNLLAYMITMAVNGRNESNELSRMLYATADYRADWEKADRELEEYKRSRLTQ